MPVTIYEIAERAGVSSSTVARILRGECQERHRRSVASAKRIRQLATEMGYRPNLRARAFSRRRTHGIGLLYTDNARIFEGMNSVVVSSLVRTVQRAGYHLVFAPIDDSGLWEEIVLGGQIDGGVIFQTLPPKVSDAVRERQLPIVMLGDNSDPAVPKVVVDDFDGAVAATRHLIGLGHQRIMFFLHESFKPHSSIAERQAGYRAAMAEAGLESSELMQMPEENAIHLLMRSGTRPTAVVCYSNLEATLIMHAMGQFRVSIPGDLSLVGFDDSFAVEHMTPPLTTVSFDAAKIGELGAQLVLQEIDVSRSRDPLQNGRTPTLLTIKPKLNVRGSTGPAPQYEPLRRK